MDSSIAAKANEVTQVRYTGDWSSDSKLSAIQNGYWEDPFLSFFNRINPVPRRTSLICRGYYVRFRVCDFFLRKVLDNSETPIQIVSLGCGMDTTFFRLFPQYEGKILRFVETDFQSVIEAKKQVIAANEILQVMERGKLTLVGSDLRKTETLEKALKTAGVDPELPTLFYSECVVNYLRANESENILKWISSNFPNVIWLAYEQCNGKDTYGRIMTKHFEKNGCALLSLAQTPDMQAQAEQLKRTNFQEYQVLNVWDCFSLITKDDKDPYPRASVAQQQFDEYEGLLATCMHYSIRVGVNGANEAVIRFLDTFSDEIANLPSPKPDESSTIMEWNDFSCRLDIKASDNLTVYTAVKNSMKYSIILGGIDGTSKRSTSLRKLDIDSSIDNIFTGSTVIVDDSNNFERIASAAVYHERSKSFYVFGGRKSPRKPCSPDLIQIQSTEPYVVKTLSFPDAECPPPRWRHGMDVIKDKLIVFGGKNECGVLNDCWLFDFYTGRWRERRDLKLPSARHSHTLAVQENTNYLYCIGGMEENEKTVCEDGIWRLDCSGEPESYKWTNLKQLNGYGSRIGHQTCIYNDSMIIVGGYGANSHYNLNHFATVVDLKYMTARGFYLQPEISKMFLPFGFSLSCVTDAEKNCTKLVVFGGGGNCFSFGTFLNEHMLVLQLNGGEAGSNVFTFGNKQ